MPGQPIFNRFTTVSNVSFPLTLKIGTDREIPITNFVHFVASLATYEQPAPIFEPEMDSFGWYKYTTWMFDRYRPMNRIKVVISLSRQISPDHLERLLYDCCGLTRGARLRACEIFCDDFLRGLQKNPASH